MILLFASIPSAQDTEDRYQKEFHRVVRKPRVRSHKFNKHSVSGTQRNFKFSPLSLFSFSTCWICQYLSCLIVPHRRWLITDTNGTDEWPGGGVSVWSSVGQLIETMWKTLRRTSAGKAREKPSWRKAFHFVVGTQMKWKMKKMDVFSMPQHAWLWRKWWYSSKLRLKKKFLCWFW